jgi:uncharacterized protein (TIGR00369 family)
MQFEHYDEAFAQASLTSHEVAGGLAAFLEMRGVHSGPGELDVEIETKPALMTPFGNLHGGVISALCDHVLGAVCYPVIPKGSWAATTEFKLNLIGPVTEGTVRAEARIESLTKRTAVVRIRVVNGERLVCLAQGTVLVMPPKAAPAP